MGEERKLIIKKLLSYYICIYNLLHLCYIYTKLYSLQNTSIYVILKQYGIMVTTQALDLGFDHGGQPLMDTVMLDELI